MLLVLSSELSLRGMLAKRERAMTKNQLFRPLPNKIGVLHTLKDWRTQFCPPGGGGGGEGPNNIVAVVDQ